ncbi:MAG: NADH-quinone oxidoreductase subunit A [Candidatus Marinimicrobia bacterium]|nr:NADH-quinone oxidoreductase subunit A [Candidatus Neomarinimicrobiota bacterium]
MYLNYSPIIIYTILAIIMVVVPLFIQSLISPRNNKGGSKLKSYECGEVPEGSAWVKFNVRFYVIALIFIIFDVEVVFMFPWAVVFQELGLLAFVEMFIFLTILLVGFAYVWIKGDLDWVKMKMKYAHGRYSKLSIKEEA